MTERNGNGVRFSWVIILTFVLGLFVWGYSNLDARVEKKADKDAVIAIQADVREIRNYLLGPKR